MAAPQAEFNVPTVSCASVGLKLLFSFLSFFFVFAVSWMLKEQQQHRKEGGPEMMHSSFPAARRKSDAGTLEPLPCQSFRKQYSRSINR